mmetsp:Transcript_5562/g.10408  ORF Transcript_5562/g.10408 Transcript_5562/m.10408 type:complete len:324 (-) Transcript_5562:1382-2353(-)
MGARETTSNFISFFVEEAPKLSMKHNVTAVPTFLFCNSDGSVIARIDGGEDVALVTQFYSKLVNASSTALPSPSQQQPQQSNEQTPPQQSLEQRLQSLITSSLIMLFMKGTPSSPRCGFSRQAVEMLTSSNVSFGTFDILQDEEVRQGLKTYSDWPTYPQLYVRGELVGGLDIMKEMLEEEGGLVSQLELEDYVLQRDGGLSKSPTDEGATTNRNDNAQEALKTRLETLINRHRVMLFMKGIPSAPRCGFSRQIVEILDSFGVSYDAFNILEDEEVRQGLKEFSDWPTFPQLYVEGDLVGGLDIVKEMEESGDLKDLLTGGKD